jgi:hypothetical protein
LPAFDQISPNDYLRVECRHPTNTGAPPRFFPLGHPD